MEPTLFAQPIETKPQHDRPTYIEGVALSIRQPWAWMILHAGKDIENRSWPTKFRGRVLIHAAKGITYDEWIGAWGFSKQQKQFSESGVFMEHGLTFSNIERGGIVGEVEIVDCVTRSDSPWFMGEYGFVLRNPKPLPFYPCRGQLGFFRI